MAIRPWILSVSRLSLARDRPVRPSWKRREPISSISSSFGLQVTADEFQRHDARGCNANLSTSSLSCRENQATS